MKNRLYKFLAIIMLSIFVSACGNKESHKEDNGNSHNENKILKKTMTIAKTKK